MRYLALLALLTIGGCATQHNVHIAPLQVEPIQVTMDVNVNVHESDEPVGSTADDERAADEQESAAAQDEPAEQR